MTTRQRLIERDGETCPHCGTTEGLTIQHRAVKGMGGRPSAERPSNLMLLCWWANWAAEALPDFAALARDAGWKLSTTADPASRPFWDHPAQAWVQPHDDWTRTTQAVVH